MQYALVNNGFVVLGPMVWKYGMFKSALEDDLEITGFQLPLSKDDATPIEVDANTRILPARYGEQPSFNPKIEFLQGPYWTFANDEAVGTFVVEPLPIEAVKNFLKERVANTRWNKETAGIKVDINGTEYTIDTARGSRDIFLQAYQLNAAGNTWKFPEGWVVLSVGDLATIVAAVMGHVQAQFTWEGQKVVEIDACTTLVQLDAIDLGEPPPIFIGE